MLEKLKNSETMMHLLSMLIHGCTYILRKSWWYTHKHTHTSV